MKTLKNKFIILIILFIVLILGTQIYKSFFISIQDRNSHIILIDWIAELNNKNLTLNNKYKLKALDKIETIWEESLAIIKWGDWSVTRIWWNSLLVIKKANVEKNLLKINISFKLEKGKTWSQVVSFIWEWSYFHQSFADKTAAIRWTIFEVNLEKDYLYVEKHEVKLTNKYWVEKIISEKKPFIISEFDFIELFEFLKNFKDAAWQDLNKKLDIEFYKILVKQIWDINKFTSNKIYNISELSNEKRKELYNIVLKQYQNLNFISVNDIENYKKKLKVKQNLINLSSNQNKEKLLMTTIYDIKDLAKSDNFEALVKNLTILSENKNILNELNMDVSQYINIDTFKNIKIPDELKQEFENSINNIKQKINLENINFHNSITKWLKNSFDKSINDIKNNIWDIQNIINDK